MKKAYGVMLLAGLMAVQGGITSFAASETEGDGQGATSYGHIGITPGGGGTTDPILPEDGGGGGETENTAELRVDYVSPFEFGSHELSNTTEEYTLSHYGENPFVQVSDFRGTGEGWTLYVSGTDFIDNETEHILRGAELVMPAGNVSTVEGNTSVAPEAQAVVVSSIPAPVMSAKNGAGMVTWANELNKNEVKLTIPSGNYAGDYQATLTWTLSDALQ